MNFVRANGTQLHKMAAALLPLYRAEIQEWFKEQDLQTNQPQTPAPPLCSLSSYATPAWSLFFTITFYTPVIDRPNGFQQAGAALIGRTEMGGEAI